MCTTLAKMTTLTSIAEKLLAQAKEIDAYAASKGVPLEAFTPKSELPEHLQRAREGILNGSTELKRLASGPTLTLEDIAYNVRRKRLTKIKENHS